MNSDVGNQSMAWVSPQTPRLLLSTPTDGVSELQPGVYLWEDVFISGNHALGALSYKTFATEDHLRPWTVVIPVAEVLSFASLLGYRLTTDVGVDKMALYVVNYGTEGVHSVHVHYNADNALSSVTFARLRKIKPGPNTQYTYKASNAPKSHNRVTAETPDLTELADNFLQAANGQTSAWNDIHYSDPTIKRVMEISRAVKFNGAYSDVFSVLKQEVGGPVRRCTHCMKVLLMLHSHLLATA